MRDLIIGFIGGGNMARSMIAGLIAADHHPQFIHVAERNADKRRDLQEEFAVLCTDSVKDLTQMADVLMLAVKPDAMPALLQEIKDEIMAKKPLLLSVAAGLTIAQYENWLSPELAIVRVMPNTPSHVRQGASGLYANGKTSESERQTASKICSAMGLSVWVESEELLQAVTAVSGCGPAYYFLFTEYLAELGADMGLPAETAAALAQQTLLGAGLLAQHADVPLGDLRQQVASPGGATQAAIDSLRDNGLKDVLAKGMQAAVARSAELSADTDN